MHILNDCVFERIRAYIYGSTFCPELYFEKRLLDIAHNHSSSHLKLPSTATVKIQEPSFLEKLSETIHRFLYTNDPSRNHVVEVELGMCS